MCYPTSFVLIRFKMKKNIFFAIGITLSIHSFAQFSIHGTITDSLSQAIPGATVHLLETYKGIFTDNNGKYKITNLKEGNYTVSISFVGYESQRIKIDNLNRDKELNVSLKKASASLGEIIVAGTRVQENSPFVHTDVSKKDFEKNNLGQDLPVLLENTTSMVVTSDAGAGVGYTGIRIRGSDATRINVTVNGIPINDAESQGVFWVNMPDFASTTDNIQIQRGVGSSTNGAGAFGGSINLKTADLKEKAYGEIATSYGSFNTHKETVKFGSGLINNVFAFDGRLSNIQSDGYIDRAFSNLKSYYLSGDYYGKKTAIKAIIFSGKEDTYQSWWGTPEGRITGNKKVMETHAMNNGFDSSQTYNLLNAGRTYNYYQYDNQTDNYQQDHYQLHFSHQVNEKLDATLAFHYTYGRGYYEELRKQEPFSAYSLPNLIFNTDTITSSDIVRKRWLDNDFYGTTFNINYKNEKLKMTFGGAYNNYDGGHYGEIIWAQYASSSNIRDRYYDNNSHKKDFNAYLKTNYLIGKKTTVFTDLQIRTINYKAAGIDNNQSNIWVNANYVFFNPKAGISHQINTKMRVYTSFSVGNKEPNRTDFIDNPVNKQPKHETLFDYEAGLDVKLKKIAIQGNFYYMNYSNQLILTGELNDVGSSIRTNVDKSYRRGVELTTSILISKKVKLSMNGTYSQNKIKDFTEVIYDYTNGFDIVEKTYTNTDIAFSPNLIGAASIEYNPLKGLNLMLQSKYVGEQFLDNTSNKLRRIRSYETLNGRISYSIFPKKMQEISFNFLVNNMLNKLYSSNGYSYNYIFGTAITENFYYPQAGTNFLVGVTLKF